MNRGEKLKRYIEEKGFNIMSLSKVSGVPYTTIRSMIERNLTNASIDNTIKLCKVLGISVESLLDESNEENQEVRIDENETTYPYLPVSISAGMPIEVDPIEANDIESISIPDSVMGKWAGRNDIFIMRVNGESMNKIIPHNSLIAVKQVELSQLKDGDIVVYSDNVSYAVKHFYNDTVNKKLIFRPNSNDKSFTDYIVSYENAQNVKIHGKVVIYVVEID